MSSFSNVLVQSGRHSVGIGSVLTIKVQDHAGSCWLLFLLLLVVATTAFIKSRLIVAAVVVDAFDPSIGDITPNDTTHKGHWPKEIHPEIAGSRVGPRVRVKVHASSLIEHLKDTVSNVQERQQ